MANALTALRLLLALPAGLALASGAASAPMIAAVAIIVAIATDLIDGTLARRLGTSTALGGTFDHATDCIFVVCGMAGGVARGVMPWVLPVLVAVAFAQYSIDSYWLHRERLPRAQSRGLRASRLGRYNGILYFTPICGDTLVRLGMTFLGPAVTLVCWLLVASTCASIAERLILALRARRTDLV